MAFDILAFALGIIWCVGGFAVGPTATGYFGAGLMLGAFVDLAFRAHEAGAP